MLDTDLVETGEASNDLGHLAWVLDELKKSLDGATKAMRRFVRDAELARGSDLASLDASQLRIARQQLHQAVGAMEMVGLGAPARVMRAMESVAQKFVARPELCSDEAATKVEQASFALSDFLEGLLKGKAVTSVALFHQYRQVMELLDGERIHPADLWSHEWRWSRFPLPESAAALTYGPAVRSHFDQGVLKLVKGSDAASALRLRDISLGLSAGDPHPHASSFWQVAAAFFEAVARGRIPSDVYSKRCGSRILQQFATLAKGENNVSDGLAQDLLFFCAHASASPSETPVLHAVRQAFGVAKTLPVNYDIPHYGKFDPALLAGVRKRIATAAESWSALAGGDTNKLKQVTDQFAGVADSMQKMHPDSAGLAQSLIRAVDSAVRTGEPPSTPVAMEVATAVLYLEAAYEDLDPTNTEMAERGVRLASRLDKVADGGQSEPLEEWMEELYRRVSDRQTMGSVVGELRGNLAEIEKSLDVFFRNPADKSVLGSVPGQLSQMRGVFSVLGLDQASTAMLRLRDSVERMLIDNVDKDSPAFLKLGNSLGAVGFLIDMLSYQRAMAKKVFAWDEEKGEFTAVMGRRGDGHAPVASLAASSGSPGSEKPSAAPATDGQAVARAAAVPVAASAVAAVAATALPAGLPSLELAAPAAAAPEAPAVAPATPKPALSEDELEIREIFLEEAVEVVQNGKKAIEALQSDPSNLADQTTLRRAFHTLKGSSRMIGLTDFGEAAWSMEQLMNAWLADQKPASDDLLMLTGRAMSGFGLWVQKIADGTDDRWSSKAFREAADAMRLDTKLVALPLPEEPAGTQADPQVTASTAAAAAVAEGSSLAQPSPSQWPSSSQLPELDARTEIGAPDTQILDGQDSVEVGHSGFQPTEFANSKGPASVPPPASVLPAFGMDDVDFAAPVAAKTGPSTSQVPAASPSIASDDIDVPEFSATRASQLDDEPPTSRLPLDDEPTSRLPLEALEDLPKASPPSAPSEPVAEVVPQPLLGIPEPAAVPDLVELPSAFSASVQAPMSVQPVDASRDAPAPTSSAPPLDESVKVIGDLRIGIPLYNVYLNEADEWSRRLQTELGEWALELDHAVPEAAIAFAHSLAGSSATVGFQALSSIARTLELAMQHIQLRGRGEPHHAATFSAAAEDIRRLLHQFAAGFLKEPNQVVQAQLQEILDSAFSPSLGTESQQDEAPAGELTAQDLDDLDFSAAPPAAAQVPSVDSVSLSLAEPAVSGISETKQPEARAESPQAATEKVAEASTIGALSALAAPAAVAAAATLLPAAALQLVKPTRRQAQSLDDDIDAEDRLDADLFPIFDEEAQELMPQLGGALRQWSARPDNMGARAEALRVLHTLKGSARLAGAMRLGEMTHRMETAIEELGSEDLQASQVEPLLARFDAVQQAFEQLKDGGEHGFALPEGPVSGFAPDAALETGAAADASGIPAPGLVAAPAPAPLGAVPLRQAARTTLAPVRQSSSQTLRVRSALLDRLLNQSGEVMIARSRLESRLDVLRGAMADLTANLDRMRRQLRDIEIQAESQMQSRLAQAKELAQGFDPLEFDQFTRLQELTRQMAESVNDVATVQRNIQMSVEGTEDDLIAQGRQARELQRDLLRTRMVEFESISERLYGVVRQAAKDAGKQVKLDIEGGSIDVDRSVLERMAPAFEHLLRNSVAHGIEAPALREQRGKPVTGTISVHLAHQGNELTVTFGDDGGGLDLDRIRQKALSSGVAADAMELSDAEAANLIFLPGFSTAASVTEIAGRGIGMDVVRSEMNAVGGRIETSTQAGQGTQFKLVMPLTTAITQVVMLRTGNLSVGVPANIVEIVRRVPQAALEEAYRTGSFGPGSDAIPFFWGGALLQASARSDETHGKNLPVVIFRSAGQRMAMHIDEVLGNQEVVVKNLGPQLSRLPGLTGMSVLASGAAVLIYNPVALVSVYGDQARAWSQRSVDAPAPAGAGLAAPESTAAAPPIPMGAPQSPLVLVVDDSITVRRVTQRLLKREGYRVALAADGLLALEQLAIEKPTVVLSDIEMPRMDGFDLARNIRGHAEYKDLPIIMITSRIAEKHREHARELGVDHYLGKPYSEDELLRLVQQYCAAVSPA